MEGSQRDGVAFLTASASDCERAGVDLLEAFSAFAAGRPDRAIDLTLIAAAARPVMTPWPGPWSPSGVARKPAAEACARQLVTENGGSADALRW